MACNHAMLLVQLGFNSTRDVWKFSCQIGLAPAGGSSNFGKISKHHSYYFRKVPIALSIESRSYRQHCHEMAT
jgi:hypothetical protein